MPVCASSVAEAQTVNDVLRSGTCGGEAREILGLANRTARMQICMFPGTLAEFGGGGGVTTGWDANARYTTIRLADVSGDGRADLCARASDGLRCWISEGTHFERQWRGSAWSDARGFADPSITATLSLGGVGRGPMHSLQGGCACAFPRRSGTRASAFLLVLAGLLVFRRRRAVSRSAGRSAAHAASARRA